MGGFGGGGTSAGTPFPLQALSRPLAVSPEPIGLGVSPKGHTAGMAPKAFLGTETDRPPRDRGARAPLGE